LYGYPRPAGGGVQEDMDLALEEQKFATEENMAVLSRAQEEATAMHTHAVNGMMAAMKKTMVRQMQVMRGVMGLEGFLRCKLHSTMWRAMANFQRNFHNGSGMLRSKGHAVYRMSHIRGGQSREGVREQCLSSLLAMFSGYRAHKESSSLYYVCSTKFETINARAEETISTLKQQLEEKDALQKVWREQQQRTIEAYNQARIDLTQQPHDDMARSSSYDHHRHPLDVPGHYGQYRRSESAHRQRDYHEYGPNTAIMRSGTTSRAGSRASSRGPSPGRAGPSSHL